jgi:Tol biopolymer transport system component
MYLPQPTTGPSAVAWSPDGSALVYSLQGRLWRQRIGTEEAEQLTAGGGYDFQPDWSPDGQSIVYVSYQDDAMELWLLDLDSLESRPLTANGAVNLEPRFSPDGKRLAFVSTQFEKRWVNRQKKLHFRHVR